MVYVCELLTEEPEGGSAMIPLKTFLSLYGYLANLNCTGEPEALDVCFCESASEIGKEEDEFREKEGEEEEEKEEELDKKISKETVSDLSSCSVDQIGEENESGSQVAADESSLKVVQDEVDQVSGEDENQEQPIQNQTEDPTVLEDAKALEIAKELSDERTSEGAETSEDDKKDPEIVTIFDHSDQSPELEPANDDFVSLKAQGTPRDSFEIEEDREGLDDEEIEVEETDEKKDADDYSFSFKGEGTETSSFGDEYSEHEPIGLEKLLEGTCECVEPKADIGSGEEIESPVDPVEEFLSRMKVQFPNPCELFKVPGIGPKVSEDKVTAVGLWLADCSRRQNGVVGPRNMRNFLCPFLDEHPAHEQYERTKLKCS